MEDEKLIRRVGSSYHDLLAFPKAARKEAGFQLGKVQAGLDPENWKPFDEAIYVLHCFQKRTPATSKRDKEIAEVRYRAVMQGRKDAK